METIKTHKKTSQDDQNWYQLKAQVWFPISI